MAEPSVPWPLPSTILEPFEATPEEQARLASVPSLQGDADGWRKFASRFFLLAVTAYHEGEITLERAIRAVRSCALGCTAQERRHLIALTGQWALDHPPQATKKKVPNPLWVRRAAAMLVQWHRELRPGPYTPTDYNHGTTPILQDTIACLRALELCDEVTPQTVYEWHREADKAGVLEPLPGDHAHDRRAGEPAPAPPPPRR